MKRILVTGASGFVARHFLQIVRHQKGLHATALTRHPERVSQAEGRVEVLRGDFLEPATYLPHLTGVDTVVHFAAATGKARAEEFERVNVEGTLKLVETCRAAGVRAFLYVSTIAVRYPNVEQYPYARSKMRAEEIVRESGLSFAILRPTIVLGKGSAVWDSFSTLVRQSAVIVPGSGTARMQPVHADDLAEVMAALVQDGAFGGETYEVGGREELDVETFLMRIHGACYGGDARVIHVPLSVLLPVLSLGERLAFSLVPATAGQFSAFRFDSTASKDVPFDQPLPLMRSVDAMLEELCA